jgi:hypothetical protein
MKKYLFAGLMTCLMLPACEATREQFDFSKKAPDEFAVVRRAPLEMPPSFNQMPPPKPGAPRPQELSATDLAKSAVIGTEAMKQAARQNGVTEGEAILLQKTGALNASPAIRATVDKETAEQSEEGMAGIDKLKKLVGQDVEGPAKTVDPVAEIERLKKNKAAGQPVTADETPVKKD